MAITESTVNVSTHEEGGKIEWQLLELIGKGTYGEVYKGKSCKGKDELEVAVKVTEFNLSKNEETKTELAVLEKYSHHENIVKFIDAQFVETLTGTEQLWIVTEVKIEFQNVVSVVEIYWNFIYLLGIVDRKRNMNKRRRPEPMNCYMKVVLLITAV